VNRRTSAQKSKDFESCTTREPIFLRKCFEFEVWGFGFGIEDVGVYGLGFGPQGTGLSDYRGTLLMGNRTHLGPYSRPMHRVLWGRSGGG
jgi:hypothetical protein